jgi:uncharacterized membrane protein YkgB
MNYLANMLGRSGLLKRDLDYHLLRAAMVIIFAWFGYDKWFEAEIRGLLPIITHGPFIFWTIPVLGIRGTAIFLGASEWTFGTLLLLGFWNKKAECWALSVQPSPSSLPSRSCRSFLTRGMLAPEAFRR